MRSSRLVSILSFEATMLKWRFARTSSRARGTPGRLLRRGGLLLRARCVPNNKRQTIYAQRHERGETHARAFERKRKNATEIRHNSPAHGVPTAALRTRAVPFFSFDAAPCERGTCYAQAGNDKNIRHPPPAHAGNEKI